jgi:hypothetical protein
MKSQLLPELKINFTLLYKAGSNVEHTARILGWLGRATEAGQHPATRTTSNCDEAATVLLPVAGFSFLRSLPERRQALSGRNDPRFECKPI